MDKSPEQMLVKISEAAMLSCSARTVRRMVNAGTLSAVRLTDDPRSDRIRLKSLEQFCDQGGNSQWQSTEGRTASSGSISSSAVGRPTEAVQKKPLKTRAEKFERRERLAIETGQTNLQQGVRTYGQMMDRYEPPASMRSAYRMIKAAIPAATPHTSIVARAHGGATPMLAEGYSPCTINRKLAIVKRMLNLAYKEWEWIPVALGPKIVKCSEVGTERGVYLTMEELEDAATCMSEVGQAALWIAAFTGLRRSNVLGLLPEIGIGETKRLIVPARMTKSSKPIALPVPQSLWSTMDMLPLQIDDWGLRQEWDAARNGMGWDHADNRFRYARPVARPSPHVRLPDAVHRGGQHGHPARHHGPLLGVSDQPILTPPRRSPQSGTGLSVRLSRHQQAEAPSSQ